VEKKNENSVVDAEVLLMEDPIFMIFNMSKGCLVFYTGKILT
jgi:hypothetical protein